MKRIFTLVTSVILALGFGAAAPVNKDEAREIAKQFIKSRQAGKAQSLGVTNKVETALESEELYVFNVGDTGGGFVIVSAEDQTIPVLGWSTEGTYEQGKVNPSVAFVIEDYKQQINSLRESSPLGGVLALASQQVGARGGLAPAKLTAYDNIEPIVPYKWDQIAPYNHQVPLDQKTGKPSYTGCPAVSLAQVMATIHPAPEMLRDIPQQDVYGIETGTGSEKRVMQQHLESLPKTSFNWSILKQTYADPSEEGESASEIARLMKYCGYSLGMTYSAEFSGSTSLSTFEALRLFWGYKNIQIKQRMACKSQEWEETIYNEISNGRPVIHDATSIDLQTNKLSGHSFIIDGYKDGYYHVNWGWGGNEDGYYILSVLNSELQEAKGKNQSNGYSIDRIIIYNFTTPTGTLDTSDRYALAVAEVGVHQGETRNVTYVTVNRSSTDQAFPEVKYSALFSRKMSPYADRCYDIGWNLFSFSNEAYVYNVPRTLASSVTIFDGDIKDCDFHTEFPASADLPDGSYALEWYYRDLDAQDNNWYPCIYSKELYHQLYVENKQLTLQPSYDNLIRENDVTIDNMRVVSKARIYQPVSIEMEMTNNTISEDRGVYLYTSTDKENYILSSATGMDTDTGNYNYVHMQFTPYSLGTHYLQPSSSVAYDTRFNMLNKPFEVYVEGTSLRASVTNIDKYDENGGYLLTDTKAEGIATMQTTEALPCTQNLYLVLRYLNENNYFIYDTNPSASTNLLVTSRFDSNNTVEQSYTFKGLKPDSAYRLAIGEEQNGKIVILDNVYGTFYTPSSSAVQGVSEAAGTTDKADSYYDLNGRKLSGKPAHKGLYIRGGKTIVAE